MEGNGRQFLSAKAWLVLAVAAVLYALALGAWYLFFADRSPSPGLMAIVGALFFIAGSWFAVYGVLLDSRLALTVAFPDAVEEASDKAHEIRRDLNRILVSAEGLQTAIARETESVESLSLEKGRTDAMLADAELRLNEQLSARRLAQDGLRQWQDRTLEVIRGIERLVTMDGVSDDYAAGAEKGAPFAGAPARPGRAHRGQAEGRGRVR